MVTISVKISADIDSKLAAEARAKRTSKSAVIRDSLEKRFVASKTRARPTVYERTKHLAGSLKGLPKDLSSNKKHMEGFGA
jgi:predicted transcriptional regulator